MAGKILSVFPGYRLEHIKKLTPGQFLFLLEAAVKTEKARLAQDAVAMRAAYHAEGKKFERYLESLNPQERQAASTNELAASGLVLKEIQDASR